MEIELSTLTDARALRADAPAFERWIGAALAEAQRERTTPREALARIEARLSDPSTLVLVARAGAELAGGLVCLAGEEPLSGERECEIVVLHVETQWRHRGLASALVTEAARRLGAAGIHSLRARVQHNDDARISMGERWGFVRTHELMERS